MATFLFAPSSENSSLLRWLLGRATLLVLRTLHCKSEQDWHPRSALVSTCHARKCEFSLPWVRPPVWRPLLTRRFPRCFSSSRKSSDTGAPAFLRLSCSPRFPASSRCVCSSVPSHSSAFHRSP